jgi:citrate lyase subunit beta/citryl-CoA lyase
MTIKIKMPQYPGWRSLLFIPAHVEKFIAKAHTRGADAYILDLEDSVPLAEKAKARTNVIQSAKQVTCDGAGALVRINLEAEWAMQDLEASIDMAVQAIVLPKVESPKHVQAISERITVLEEEREMPLGYTKLILMIESIESLPDLDELARSDERVLSMTLGSEDFSASAGMQSCPETLLYPNQMVAYACRRAGLVPLGFPASIADYADMDVFEETIQRAKKFGFVGAFCIHPKQADVLNAVLTPSEGEVAYAQGVIDAFDKGMAEGRGAVEYQGKMIDLPVVISARALLARYQSIQK